MPRTPPKDQEPPKDNLFVDEDDLVELDDDIVRPVMVSINLEKVTPEDFGLDSWSTETFKIPDFWMKKIYQHDVYIDTDLEDPRACHDKMTAYQRRILMDWLKERKGTCDFLGPTRRSQAKPRQDELAQHFEDSSDDSDVISVHSHEQRNEDDPQPSTSSGNTIALCAKHKIQPEEGIVNIALDKMKFLSDEDEETYQNLLIDKEFMSVLASHVKLFISK